jgi:FkbM family methyltransferase
MANIPGLLDKYSNNGDERFFHELFEKEEYKPVKFEPQVVIDVGALAGEFSAYVYDQTKEIYAIEPYSEHYKELKDNVKEFNLDKIKPFNLALAKENGEVDLVIAARGGHVITRGSNSDKTEKVKCQTLATFIKEQGIEKVDILKIDVEGAETEILEAPDFKEIAERINLIIGEHLDGVDGLLQELGFGVRQYGVNKIFERKNG